MVILSLEGVKLYYSTTRGSVKAVDGVDLSIERGEALAIVGESGCGKSSLALTIIRLLPRNVELFEGRVLLDGVNIVELSEEEFRRGYRWRRVSMVFQGAMNSLNPVINVGRQVAEPLEIHLGMDREEALERARETLSLVRLPDWVSRRYPHELSGGMRQRVVVAMALVMRPELVILDEPTSALDVITQASIMNLLKQLKQELGLTYIFITHDLALASEIADKMAVFYAGKVVEFGGIEEVLLDPMHPYTKKLVASVPSLRRDRKPEYIPGAPPDLVSPPSGCRFHPRCPYAWDVCSNVEPRAEFVGKRTVYCWLYSPTHPQPERDSNVC